MAIFGAPASTNQPLAPRGPVAAPAATALKPQIQTPQSYNGGVGAGGALFAQAHAGLTPAQKAAQAVYAPSAAALAAQQQNTLTQAALAGQQYSQASTYAQQQYNTANAGLGLDQNDINLQQQGLGSDRRYLGQSHGINVGNYRNDINYDVRQRAYANQLFGSMMQGLNTQRGPNGTIQQQLGEALGKIQVQRSQAQGQFTDASQQLAQQVGAQGAFGSLGSAQRQGFLGSTLGNTLAGLHQDTLAAQTQRQMQTAQLGQQIAQTVNQRQTTVSLANRRQKAAQYGIQQANADFQHGLAGNTISSQRLGIQSQRLGITREQYANALQNAIRSAGLQYDSGISNSQSQLAQYGPQQQSLYFNQVGAANALGQAAGSGLGNGAQGPFGPQGP